VMPSGDTLQMYLDFDKARDLPPSARQGLFLEYSILDGVPTWTHKPSAAFRAAEIRRVARSITNKNIIAAMVGCPLWQVHQVLSEPDHTTTDELNEDYDEPLF
jgi:hypothetical protein